MYKLAQKYDFWMSYNGPIGKTYQPDPSLKIYIICLFVHSKKLHKYMVLPIPLKPQSKLAWIANGCSRAVWFESIGRRHLFILNPGPLHISSLPIPSCCFIEGSYLLWKDTSEVCNPESKACVEGTGGEKVNSIFGLFSFFLSTVDCSSDVTAIEKMQRKKKLTAFGIWQDNEM